VSLFFTEQDGAVVECILGVWSRNTLHMSIQRHPHSDNRKVSVALPSILPDGVGAKDAIAESFIHFVLIFRLVLMRF